MKPGPSSEREPVYWFPAKRRGWGWGLPVVWQGRLVFVAFFLLLAAGAVVLIPSRGELVFLGYAVLLVLLLVATCVVKGEPPTGRRGR